MADKIVMALCMPMARGIQPATMRSLLAAMRNLREEPYVQVHLFDPVGFQIDIARNMITQQALNTIPDLTHFMWIDDDMVFEPDAIRRLLNHNLPIVGGLCFNRRHPYGPVLVNFTERGFAFDYDYPEGLNQYDATGAAFLLVKADVFRTIRQKFPEGPWSIMGISEDVSFCKRATAAGFKVMVDTRVKIGHISPEVVIDEAFARRNRMFRANPWFPHLPMPEGPPVASVVIPTWNGRRPWLRAAVDSALRQTVPVEIIVVDDGSDDPVTLKDLGWVGDVSGITDKRFDRVRIIRHEKNRGCFAALNTGIAAMTTEWFSWLSDDDLFYPPKIERQIAAMREAGALVSYHSYDVMIAEGCVHEMVWCPYGWRTIAEQQAINSKNCVINGLTTLIHRSVLDEVRLPDGNVFNTSFTIAADWELWNRIGVRHLWRGLNDILATRRQYRDEIMNASQRYAADPEKVKVWMAEDEAIRRLYAPEEKP